MGLSPGFGNAQSTAILNTKGWCPSSKYSWNRRVISSFTTGHAFLTIISGISSMPADVLPVEKTAFSISCHVHVCQSGAGALVSSSKLLAVVESEFDPKDRSFGKRSSDLNASYLS